ncbi:hypothetical protein AA14362_1220 [Acetobacter cerevisiae DSM 14362]|nr:hypothetical protein AA14362_1220 [Acetobacter cerevisiae DSM 14362]
MRPDDGVTIAQRSEHTGVRGRLALLCEMAVGWGNGTGRPEDYEEPDAQHGNRRTGHSTTDAN